ncbi:hypothetical protein PSC71_15905 [Devosia sp. J2-20]|mgnify:FL=1|jgi:hypothetical protein|uniref:hypothetical protein n=1 Tax=Devosia TaxID=46913 RepID=UPI0022AF95CC|nr:MULTISPECIES: hypothetical protein [Devosia]MCZ4345251.1 hypothetical protein [Devosia neptuniae]WDQ98670.1 hypothetical protein PSC71_15905 [Devosia sp. J2-20]|tara:strand:+ start:15473 stop:15862 length:390 start_codon:yes stop_codon:yes gene_type:complete
MTYLRIVLLLIAISQLALGVLTLFAPEFFLASMGLATPPSDSFYLIGMLAARFLAFGVVLIVLARRPQVDALWLQAMLAIQLVDLGVGLFYTANGVLPLAVSGFPMFNAILFSGMLLIALRRQQPPIVA